MSDPTAPAEALAAEPLAVLLGCTASGKESAALHAAALLGAEIVCADSVKPYRGLAIAAAAPGPAALAQVPHHVVGVADPAERMTARRWAALAGDAIRDIRSRGVRPLVVGGTALYLRALLFGLFEGPAADPALRDALRAEEAATPGCLHAWLREHDPATAARLHPNDLKRVVRAVEVQRTTGRPISALQTQWSDAPRVPYCAVGIRRTREDLYRRVDARIDRMLAAGLVDEVRALDAAGAVGPTAAEAIGVKEILPVVRRERETGAPDSRSLEEAVVLLRRHTRSLVRRQDTWWRSLPGIHWLEVAPDEHPETTGWRIAEHFGRAFASKLRG